MDNLAFQNTVNKMITRGVNAESGLVTLLILDYKECEIWREDVVIEVTCEGTIFFELEHVCDSQNNWSSSKGKYKGQLISNVKIANFEVVLN